MFVCVCVCFFVTGIDEAIKRNRDGKERAHRKGKQIGRGEIEEEKRNARGKINLIRFHCGKLNHIDIILHSTTCSEFPFINLNEIFLKTRMFVCSFNRMNILLKYSKSTADRN